MSEDSDTNNIGCIKLWW